jgi:transcription initiation factor TFIIB
VGKGKTLAEVADAAGVSEATVKTAYRLLYASREELIEADWVARGRGSLEGLPRM